jgi:RNA polymerase sigma-70 factor (ECF subfamily)
MKSSTPNLSELEDDELVEQWLAGNERAATEIVGRHADSLARFAASLGLRDEIEEVVQDTFVRAFGALSHFRGESSLRTWLFTIERRLVVDRRRAGAREPATELVGADLQDRSGDPLAELLADEMSERVRKSFELLSPLQRDVFRLRAEQGMSYREIAEVLETTEGAARVHYHNAVKAVKEFLND